MSLCLKVLDLQLSDWLCSSSVVYSISEFSQDGNPGLCQDNCTQGIYLQARHGNHGLHRPLDNRESIRHTFSVLSTPALGDLVTTMLQSGVNGTLSRQANG